MGRDIITTSRTACACAEQEVLIIMARALFQSSSQIAKNRFRDPSHLRADAACRGAVE
eukprot:COSAG06_NODE_1181_length_10363_cov_10.391563_5_plen_58_part_00